MNMRFQILISIIVLMSLILGVQANTNSERLLKESFTFYFKHDYSAALHAVDQAIQISNVGCTQALRGTILLEMGRYEEAIEAFKRGIEIRPSDYVTNTHFIGECLLKLERYDEALDVYNELIQIRSDSVDYWVGKGDALYHLGRFDEANTAYRKALDLSNQYPDTFFSSIDSINEKLESIPNGNKGIKSLNYSFDDLIQDLRIS